MKQQQTINKITIDGEAHALLLTCGAFLPQYQRIFILPTNKYISIELVQWNMNIELRDQQSKKERKETRNDRKRHRNEFSCFFKPRSKHKCRNTQTHTHIQTTDGRVEWCIKNIYLGKE